jgi:hypothetical protein
MCLIQCGGLWFINGKISITWNLKQAVVKSPKPVIEGVCFLRPKPADKEVLKSMPHPEDLDELSDPVVVSTTVVESDDEDLKISSEVELEVEPEPERIVVEEPVKKGRKGKVSK